MSALSMLSRRLRWIAGALTPWAVAWFLLGLRVLATLRDTPHPFLRGMKLTGVILEAVRNWALASLAVYLLLGLLTGLLVLTWVGVGQAGGTAVGSMKYREGLGIGAATVLWIHGLLFLRLPSALGTIWGLRSLPAGVDLALLLGGGAWLAWIAFRDRGAYQPLKWMGSLATVTLLLSIPHDIFRRLTPSASDLPIAGHRVVVLSVDGLQKAVVDRAFQKGGAPAGVEPVCAVPATRMAWNCLLGGDPDLIHRDLIMPYRSEVENPGRLALLEYAREQGLRVAFVIDDALTPSYGLQPTYFSEVVEPSGGWKHWFSLGLGHTWPAYSWAENYISAVETNNPWAEPDPFFRDVGRAIARNNWTNAHLCQLHEPLFPRFAELQRLGGWRWLLRAPNTFLAYQTEESARKDHYRNNTFWSDGQEHYIQRCITLLQAARPCLDRWARAFPNLSGVLTADHGESHPQVVDSGGHEITHFAGIHGFVLDADCARIPLYPFGRTQSLLAPGTVYSWFNLRDDLGQWATSPNQPLQLTGDTKGWRIQSPTVRPTHLENSNQTAIDSQELGLRPDDLASTVYLNPIGSWYAENPPADKKPWKLSTGLLSGSQLITFNPVGKGRQLRTVFSGYQLIQAKVIPDEEARREIETFPGRIPMPWMPPAPH